MTDLTIVRNAEAVALAEQIAKIKWTAATSDDRDICQYDRPIYHGLEVALRGAISLGWGLDEHWTDQVVDVWCDCNEKIAYCAEIVLGHAASDAESHLESLMADAAYSDDNSVGDVIAPATADGMWTVQTSALEGGALISTPALASEMHALRSAYVAKLAAEQAAWEAEQVTRREQLGIVTTHLSDPAGCRCDTDPKGFVHLHV
jgi:hypothetical protein